MAELVLGVIVVALLLMVLKRMRELSRKQDDLAHRLERLRRQWSPVESPETPPETLPATPPPVPAVESAPPVVGPARPAPSPTVAASGSRAGRSADFWRRIREWLVVGEAWRPAGIPAEYVVAVVQLVRGAAVLLLVGFAFLIKYLHERALFAPEVRLLAGTVLALAVLAAGCRMARRRTRTIGLGLIGGALGGLYFLIFAAFGIYRMIGMGPAFALAGAAAAGGAMLALCFEAQSIAVLALFGGYAAPVLLVVDGTRPLIGVGCYLAAVTGGAAWMCRRRAWPVTAIGGLGVGWLLWGLAVARWMRPGDGWPVLGVSAALSGIGAVLILWRPLAERLTATAPELGMLVWNAGWSAALLIRAVQSDFGSRGADAAPPAALALCHLAAAAVLIRRRWHDRLLTATLTTLGAALLAVAVPLWFSGNWRSGCWSLLAVVLLYAGSRAGSRLLLADALVLLGAAGVSALTELVRMTGADAAYWPALGTRAATLGVWCVALWCGWWILWRRTWTRTLGSLFALLAPVMTFLATSVECRQMLLCFLPRFADGGVSVWWGCFALGMLTVGLYRDWRPARGGALGLFAMTGVKILLCDLAGQPTLYRFVGLLCVGLVMLAGAFCYVRFSVRLRPESERR